MNLDDILNTRELSEHTGHTISVEEAIVLHNTLLILQNENHFRRIFFWGKIYGNDHDYYVAFGYRKDALHDRTFYYSTNCLNWGLLPRPTEMGKKLTPLCAVKFQGDPALMLDVLIEKDETSFGEVLAEPTVRKLKEEDRLSVTIHCINEEAVVVPRGALFKRPDGVIVENLAFQGLSNVEGREIKTYLHYRVPKQKWNTNLLTRDDYNYAMDFLDTLDVDVPEGCWLHNMASGDEVVVMKTLYWPGMTFYHRLGTAQHGFLYFGNGVKCLDVPFFLYSLHPVADDFWGDDRLTNK